VVVSGAEAVQAARMGSYTRVPGLWTGPLLDRPVFKLAGANTYLFYYWVNGSDSTCQTDTNSWRIGANYTLPSSGVRSFGGGAALCPQSATGWQAAMSACTACFSSAYTIAVVALSRLPLLPVSTAPTGRDCLLRLWLCGDGCLCSARSSMRRYGDYWFDRIANRRSTARLRVVGVCAVTHTRL
jgi:hypothetical protein